MYGHPGLRDGHTVRLEFIYDEAGRPVQLIWNDGHGGASQIFNYVLNLQGDVQQIRRASDGMIVAVYDYNARGVKMLMKMLTTHRRTVI